MVLAKTAMSSARIVAFQIEEGNANQLCAVASDHVI
jgi:hypothetical protein